MRKSKVKNDLQMWYCCLNDVILSDIYYAIDQVW